MFCKIKAWYRESAFLYCMARRDAWRLDLWRKAKLKDQQGYEHSLSWCKFWASAAIAVSPELWQQRMRRDSKALLKAMAAHRPIYDSAFREFDQSC